MPGKFSDETAAKLYEMSLDGGPDEETGSVQEQGWFGLMVSTGLAGAEHAILEEDSQGFVSYSTFDSEEAARAKFAELEAELETNEEG